MSCRIDQHVAAIIAAALFLSSCDAEEFVFDDPLPAPYSFPSWLGTDSLVVFGDDTSRERMGIRVRPRDGSTGWKLVDGEAEAPSYAPSTRKLAFESNYAIFTGDIVAGQLDTLSVQQVVSDGLFPAWSPDGQWLAFYRLSCENAYDDADTMCGVYVVRADGSAPRFVARGVHPNWSPDGAQLIFARWSEVYSIDFPSLANGRQLSTIEAQFGEKVLVMHPSYSPDGESVLMEIRPHPGPSIWIMPSSGGSVSRLFDGKAPAWSPSGRFIAFVENGNEDPRKDDTIWVYDKSQRRVTQLTYR